MSGAGSNSSTASILVTGGTGFIGSHIAVELAHAGLRPVLYDNLCNSKASVVDHLATIIGKPVDFVQGDIRDGDLMRRTLREQHVTAVIHLAALKSVGESIQEPERYHEWNVGGSQSLIDAMQSTGVRHLVFSSSAAVYGVPERVPVSEDHPCAPTHPYGHTKLAVESLLKTRAASDASWHIVMLRYFNPVGAHDSGLIGEDPSNAPDNLMPLVMSAAAGMTELQVWGTDYPTPDGSGVRDFIHVCDLAAGHVAALRHLDGMRCEAINLGTGRGISVLELVQTFERVNGVRVPLVLRGRRDGDVAISCASVGRAFERLGWRIQRTLEDMCRDAWRWQNSVAARQARG
ncbi:MAG: UDP-glucose 4-epimerase GalE [Planctomycetes bacterium]|nr:UDP-glucose 4-epimerase GalE [Planctomycetota bacterium]